MRIAVLGTGVVGRTIAGTLRLSPSNYQFRVVR
jgi:ketopantoate reductase